MSKYDLIAFDMDGTLLDSNNAVRESSRKAIEDAVKNGKIVAVCTGRAVGEIRDYKESSLKDVRYFVCENGALLYDSQKKEVLSAEPIPDGELTRIVDIVDGHDAMVVMANYGQNTLSSNDARRMEYFHAERYKELELKTAVQYENVIEVYRKEHFQVEKFNVYAADTKIRDELLEQVCKLPVTTVYAEETGFEVTPLGMSKATGLKKLCEFLEIELEATIAVGDSDNDVEMLKAVGCPIAMGNAMEHVKEVAKVVVADYDHDGCAEAIYNYLL